MNESWVQRKIIASHQKQGWLCVKLIQTTLNGIPDLLLLRNGRPIFIEVKRPGVEEAEPLQVYRHRQLKDLGFEVYLTDDPGFRVPEEGPVIIPSKHPIIQEDTGWQEDVEEIVETFKIAVGTEKPVKMKAKRKRNEH
jgi:hypothetical protein